MLRRSLQCLSKRLLVVHGNYPKPQGMPLYSMRYTPRTHVQPFGFGMRSSFSTIPDAVIMETKKETVKGMHAFRKGNLSNIKDMISSSGST